MNLRIVFIFGSGLLGAGLGGAGCYHYPEPAPPAMTAAADRPEVALGQRLFREGRFAHYFFARAGGDANAVLPTGDPALERSTTREGGIPGAYAGGAMSCAVCHLVDEQLGKAGGGMRAYADFARKSPIPERGDGHTFTLRNTPTMVDVIPTVESRGLLHFDGQFGSAADLVRGTLTGRNYGWLATEEASAVAHIASIVRGDDGGGALAKASGNVPYRAAFAGVAWLPETARIPTALRLDVMRASDRQIFDAVASLVATYLASLKFSRDPAGRYMGSPYDRFLRKNDLPLTPDEGEAPIVYARRLRTRLEALAAPRFVGYEDGSYRLHAHPFQFGPDELAGLRLFLAEGAASDQGGNCVACHTPPAFSDGAMHNSGVAQHDYDTVHGAGAFLRLAIPALAARGADDLPPSADAPTAEGRFVAVPEAARPDHADLGLWGVFANPALPAPQVALRERLCAQRLPPGGACTEEALLPLTVGLFKTPSLRDLGHSAPYMHDGAFDTLEEAVGHYVKYGALAAAGLVRNVDAALTVVNLAAAEVAPLAAFLRALDEDYQ